MDSFQLSEGTGAAFVLPDPDAPAPSCTGLFRQMSFDPLRALMMQPSVGSLPPPVPAPQPAPPRVSAPPPAPAAAVEALHSVRGKASFKPEKSGKVRTGTAGAWCGTEASTAGPRRRARRPQGRRPPPAAVPVGQGAAAVRGRAEGGRGAAHGVVSREVRASRRRRVALARPHAILASFLHVLTVCFGSTFEGPGAWWYDHSHAGAFAAALLYCATSGRVRLDAAHTSSLFVKKEPERAASSWTVNEAALAGWGVAPSELAALFRGPPRREGGFPRGTPLNVPAPHDLPPPAVGVAGGGASSVAAAAGAALLLASGSLPSHLSLPRGASGLPTALSGLPGSGGLGGGGGGGGGGSSLPPSRAPSEAASLLVPLPQAPSGVVLPFGDTPLARQSTVATLAMLMCQNDALEDKKAKKEGRELDRSFSDGAAALMTKLAGDGHAAAGGSQQQPQPIRPTPVMLGAAAPAWAQAAARGK